MIYLDNSATTKPDPSVLKSFQQVNTQYYGNPSSIHEFGSEVDRLQQRAREQAAELLHVQPDEVVFTSGGTEANNMAIKGIALQHQQRGKHIITSAIEHPAVYDACKSLERLGFSVTIIPVDETGVVDVVAIAEAIREETILISVMHVNNETGAIQPLEEIGTLVRKHPKIFFHVDAVQALGKIDVPLKKANIHLCSFSGHKIHGLKGTGILYVKKGVTLFPLFHGGGQEGNLRSGTENVAGNVAFVRALRLILERQKTDYAHLVHLQKLLLAGLEEISGLRINSSKNDAPHIVNVSVPPLKPEVMIHALYEKGIVLSTKSACSSKEMDKSRVLEAYGLEDAFTRSALRISLTYDNTEAEINTFLHVFKEVLQQLKEIME